MGFFDLFKRKPVLPPDDEDGPSVHYALAHLALRHMALAEPLQTLAILASPEAEKFLALLLEDVAEKCEVRANFKASAIQVHRLRVNDFPCAILEFPQPQNTTEAFMVALVVMLDASTEDISETEEVEARYFTLEKGFTMTDEPRTVLGEWTHESHINYGDGPPADLKSFVEALERHLE